MLNFLRIRNLAIISETEVEFSAGMNVITGETGAGKSLVLQALFFLLGGKLASESIRQGTERLEVEGIFFAPEQLAARLPQAQEELRETLSAGELVVRRTLDRSGRSRASVNGRTFSKPELEALAALLVDITGQHQHGTLLDERAHREMLDEFGVAPTTRTAARQAFQEYSALRRRLEDIRAHTSERSEYFRRLSFEREELEKLSLVQGQKEEILQNLQRLAHAEMISQTVQSVLDVLDEGESGAERQLSRMSTLLEQARRADSSLQTGIDLIDAASVQLGELRLFLEEYGSRLEVEPEHLESLRERVADIARAERKYGKSEAELVEYLASIRRELSEFEAGGFDEEKLERELRALETRLRSAEDELRRERTEAARRLTKIVASELKAVNLNNARFDVELIPTDSSANGADIVRFLLAANPGQPFRPLSAVASGGELSRILLVLKTALNQTSGPLLQVFDEIDTGIGGAVAQVVGERIQALSRKTQVVLITHAPQIAALADNHVVIAKRVSAGDTSVSASTLSKEERTAEVARMLAGKKVSDHFSEAARELLAVGKKQR